MSARELTSKTTSELGNGDYSFCVINYANCDMVGHTGVIDAAVRAVETVDSCLGDLLAYLQQNNWCSLIIADHGNAEQMVDYKTGKPHTAHTTHPVPAVLATLAANHPFSDTYVLNDGSLCVVVL